MRLGVIKQMFSFFKCFSFNSCSKHLYWTLRFVFNLKLFLCFTIKIFHKSQIQIFRNNRTIYESKMDVNKLPIIFA